MKVDVTVPILQLDGTPVRFIRVACPMCGNETEGEDSTLRLMITTALSLDHPHETDARTGASTVSGDEKVRRFSLAMRVYENDEVELNEKDIVLIKEIIGKTRNPIVNGRVAEFLKV